VDQAFKEEEWKMFRWQGQGSLGQCAPALLLTIVLLAVAGFGSADDTKRDAVEGEVADKVAFVQTFDFKAGGSVCEIEAKVKFIKAGTYVVAGGYYKGKYFQEGVTGKKYYALKTVKADAGDVITVKLKAPRPPSNKKITVAIFKSEKDIRTKS
jgi:hypothetical protein